MAPIPSPEQLPLTPRYSRIGGRGAIRFVETLEPIGLAHVVQWRDSPKMEGIVPEKGGSLGIPGIQEGGRLRWDSKSLAGAFTGLELVDPGEGHR